MKAVLALEDGRIFTGIGFGIEGEVIGEIVFNTGMTGYQEVLTDPSYCGQIVTMTYPLIGNYGINDNDMQSIKPHVKGLIIRELCKTPSNWRAKENLNEYLKRNKIIGIEGIDTRMLTRILREKGTMNGIISTKEDFCYNDRLNDILSYKINNPVYEVTVKENIEYPGDGPRVIVIDLGVKRSIIFSLLKRKCHTIIVPAWLTEKQIMSLNPDGILLSNGPGNPKDCIMMINTIRNLAGKVPIFGICLGHQLMALALGADTVKLKYGHRGCNHPVKDLESGLTYITSQNHGFTVINESIDRNLMRVSHINLNDGTVEGIIYNNIPAFSVQFHPEASPGPEDTAYLFERFINMMEVF